MQSIVGSMHVPHGGLQVLVACNCCYDHDVSTLRMDALSD